MSGRCYLEKGRDPLYPEFLAGGIARKRLPDGNEEVLYESGEDLVRKTPHFYQGASRRLDADLGGAHKYARDHFRVFLTKSDPNSTRLNSSHVRISYAVFC